MKPEIPVAAGVLALSFQDLLLNGFRLLTALRCQFSPNMLVRLC
jgi:hypothetical protein